MANRNFSNGGRIYMMETSPVLIETKFTVTPTNANGITSLVGPTVANVYMHSSASTPSTLNPADGNIVIQLQDNYTQVLNVTASLEAPASGSNLTSTTAHTTYIITTVGTTTAAQWHTAGVPAGVTPAVGVAFIATATGAIGGTGAVQIPAAAGSGIMSVEVCGAPTTTINPLASANQGYGGYIILQCRNASGTITAPATGTRVQLQITMSNSSVRVQGS